MLRPIIILFFVFLSSRSFAQGKVYIGMSIDTVKKLYPGITEGKYENTITLSRPDNLYGLQDEWGYRFKEGKLEWIYFAKYIDSIDQKHFDLCLKAAQSIIRDYSKKYGKPDTVLKGKQKFIDPFKKRHWGYDVLEARWKNYKGAKISVEFTFMGGKGEYHFLVKINYFDKDYPYYD